MPATFPNRLRAIGRGPLAASSCRGGFTLMELVLVIVIIAALAALIVSNIDRTTDDAEKIAAKATMKTIAEAITGSPTGPGYIADMKYVPGFQIANLRTHDLVVPDSYPGIDKFDPVTGRGWRGPYVRNTQGVANLNKNRNGRFPSATEQRFADDATFLARGFFIDASVSLYGNTDDIAIADHWGNPIVVQIPPASAFSTTVTAAERFRFARLVSAGPDGVLTTPADRLAGMGPGGLVSLRGDDYVLFLNRADAYEN